MSSSNMKVLIALLTARSMVAFDWDAHRLTSSMAAVYTPMKSGGLELWLDQIPMYAARMKKINITNIMPCGSNGESLSLTVVERKSLAEAWAKTASQHGLKVYMHIGSESLVDSIELAKHAAATPGITGILAMTPVYFKPTIDTLHDFLKAVAGAAPELPFWFYHFPDDTGVLPGKAHEVLSIVDSKGEIPNFMGIKYTDYNLMDFQLCAQMESKYSKSGGKYNMLYGRDEQALAAVYLGADAAVSSTIEYSPTLREVLKLAHEGSHEAAKAAQHKNAQLCSLFGEYESQAKNVQKNIMRMVGIDVGPSRLPKKDLSESEYAELKAKLISMDVIDQAPPREMLI